MPGKNLRPLGGKPLVAWTIEAAKACPSISRVVVSTDSPAVAAIADEYGAETVSHPPMESNPEAPDVALHVLGLHGTARPDVVVLLLPTSPFRTAEHINEALALHEKHGRTVLSISELPNHRGLRFDRSGFLTRRPFHNGAILVAKAESLLRDGFFSPEGAVPYWMPSDAGLDINTMSDWKRAEKIMARRWALAS